MKDGKKKREKKGEKEERERRRKERKPWAIPVANFGECALCHHLQMSDARDMQMMVMCCPFP